MHEDRRQRMLRLGDCVNYPSEGELVGVHYVLYSSEGNMIQSTYEWGRIFEWRVGSSYVVKQLDTAIKNVSLGGKIEVLIQQENQTLKYEVELIFIK